MQDTLEVLNASGHLTLTWDPEDPVEVEKARKEVANLKAAGYIFFAVGTEDEDVVGAGNGMIIVEKLATPILPPVPVQEAATEVKAKGRRSVAVRNMVGG